MILSITDEMMDGYMDIKRFNQFNIHEFEKSIYNIEKIDGYEFYLEKSYCRFPLLLSFLWYTCTMCQKRATYILDY